MNVAAHDRSIVISVTDLLEPISNAIPCGESLRESDVYDRIKDARREDDPRLPRGQWERDLKQSDWAMVTQLCFEATRSKTKDLQILAWLMESQVKLHGVTALADCIRLIARSCDEYWETIHPEMVDGDIEYRTNVFDWIRRVLPVLIKKIPLTENTGVEAIRWIDLDKAWSKDVNEQPSDKPKSSNKSDSHSSPDIDMSVIEEAISRTPEAFYQSLLSDLALSRGALLELEEVLDRRLGPNYSSFAELLDLLSVMHEFASTLVSDNGHDFDEVRDDEVDGIEELQIEGLNQHSRSEREVAYDMLIEAAQYLAQDDPHSPVPPLVLKAVEYGQMDVSELYSELFVKRNGSLDLFEILGVSR